jgi:hypothetical protein
MALETEVTMAAQAVEVVVADVVGVMTSACFRSTSPACMANHFIIH